MRDLYERYVKKILHRKPYFDRGGSAALAIEGISKRLGREPLFLVLLSYKRRSHMAPEDMSTGIDGEVDDRRRIEAASVHVFHIEADGQRFVVHVDGIDVTFIEA